MKYYVIINHIIKRGRFLRVKLHKMAIIERPENAGLTRQDVKNLLLLTREVLRALLSVVDLAIASIDLYETITGFGNRAIRDGKGTDASIFVLRQNTWDFYLTPWLQTVPDVFELLG